MQKSLILKDIPKRSNQGSERKRILLGTTEIVRQLYELAEAFRILGHETHTALNSLNSFYADLPYDYLLNQGLAFPHLVQYSNHPLIRRSRGILNRTYRAIRRFSLPDFMTDYDVYVFQFGESFLPGNRDFPVLKANGKKIVSIFQGSDIRHWSATEPAREAFGLKTYAHYREGSPLREILTKLRMAERYADVIFFQPSYGELAVRPYMHLYLAMNLDLYPFNVPKRDIPLVVHAPSKRQVKGTEEILKTLEELKAEGVQFTFKLLEGIPNTEVIRTLVEADVVVDELNESHYGMLGLEAMATGCAVAGGNHADVVPLPPDPPILHLNPANLHAQLRRLLTEKSLRIRLAEAGRPFVEKYHDRCNVAQHILNCLDSVENQECDYWPSFFARYYQPPANEVLDSNLKNLTAEIVQRYGLPEGISARDLIERNLMSQIGVNEAALPRWKPNTNGRPLQKCAAE